MNRFVLPTTHRVVLVASRLPVAEIIYPLQRSAFCLKNLVSQFDKKLDVVVQTFTAKFDAMMEEIRLLPGGTDYVATMQRLYATEETGSNVLAGAVSADTINVNSPTRLGWPNVNGTGKCKKCPTGHRGTIGIFEPKTRQQRAISGVITPPKK